VNGHLVTITKTKTCERGWLNKLCEIRRALRISACQHFQEVRRLERVVSI
jgi:hypothetical protein